MICATDCFPTFVSQFWWNRSCCGSHFTPFYRCVTTCNTMKLDPPLFQLNRLCFHKTVQHCIDPTTGFLSFPSKAHGHHWTVFLSKDQFPLPWNSANMFFWAAGSSSLHIFHLLSTQGDWPLDEVCHIFCLVLVTSEHRFVILQQHPLLFFTCLHPRAPPQLCRCRCTLRSPDVIC